MGRGTADFQHMGILQFGQSLRMGHWLGRRHFCTAQIPAALICACFLSFLKPICCLLNHIHLWRLVNQGYLAMLLHRHVGSMQALPQGNASCYWTLLADKQCSGCTGMWTLDSIFTSCCVYGMQWVLYSSWGGVSRLTGEVRRALCMQVEV